MTILLIAVITFLLLGLVDYQEKKAKKDEYKKSTITNVKLEREIEIEWLETIDKELKAYTDNDYDAFGYVMYLYELYGVPKIRWNEPTDFVEKQKEEARKEFAVLRKWYAELKADGFGTTSHISVIYEQAPIDDFFHSTLSRIEDPSLPVTHPFLSQKWNKKHYEEYEEVKKRNHDWFGIRYLEVKSTGLTLYNYVMHSNALFRMYSRLISLLTMKTLKSKGFNPSPDGKHESRWQESEKTHNRSVEEDEKYPWLKP